MKGFPNKQFSIFSILIIVLFYGRKLWMQESIIDTADGVLHYQHARFMFTHPELAFNHWAKPIFTLVASIPAQFGIRGIAVLNAILVLAAAWVSYLSAKKLKLPAPFLAWIFVGLGNSITYTVLGGLTEPLFMLASAGAIYLFIDNRFKWMFLLLGASLLIRPEAVVLIPVLGLFAILKGARTEVLHFFWLPVFYSLGGYLFFDYDLLWVLTGQPYDLVNPSVYGSGSWFYYFEKWPRIAPPVVLIMAIIGGLYTVFHKKYWTHYLPIALVAFGIISVHVIIWKFGVWGSAGLIRTLVTSIPALGLVALVSLRWVEKIKFSWALPVATSMVVLIYTVQFYHNDNFPWGLMEREKAVKELAEKIENRPETKRAQKVCYQFATVAYYFQLNPFDTTSTIKFWEWNNGVPSDYLKKNDLVIWDNITALREGKMPWSRISKDTNLVRIDSVTVKNATLVAFYVK